MSDKVLITGGAQRIGKALVNHFHENGWNIIFQYRSSKEEAESSMIIIVMTEENQH